MQANVYKETKLKTRDIIRLMICTVGIIHCFYFFIFTMEDIFVMAIINGLGVCLSIWLFLISKNSRLQMISTVLSADVSLHAILATLFTSWEFGFCIFLIVLIPLYFYFPHNGIIYPTLHAIMNIIEFVLLRIYALSYEPERVPKVLPVKVYYLINSFITLSLLLIFCIAFYETIQEKQRKLEFLVDRDELTGIYNRRKMYQLLDEVNRENKVGTSVIAIGMGDIDGFKLINDTYGHSCGDVVLQEVSNCFIKKLNKIDCVSRWGGEEFLFLLYGNSYDEIVKRLDSVRTAIAEKDIFFENESIHVTMSFGLCPWDKDMNYEDLVNLADIQLYRAKNEGKNKLVFKK